MQQGHPKVVYPLAVKQALNICIFNYIYGDSLNKLDAFVKLTILPVTSIVHPQPGCLPLLKPA